MTSFPATLTKLQVLAKDYLVESGQCLAESNLRTIKVKTTTRINYKQINVLLDSMRQKRDQDGRENRRSTNHRPSKKSLGSRMVDEALTSCVKLVKSLISPEKTSHGEKSEKSEREITWLETSATAVVESDEGPEVGDVIVERIDEKEYQMEVVHTEVLDDENKSLVEVVEIDGWQVPNTTVLEF